MDQLSYLQDVKEAAENLIRHCEEELPEPYWLIRLATRNELRRLKEALNSIAD